jgi:hypothetical protein
MASISGAQLAHETGWSGHLKGVQIDLGSNQSGVWRTVANGYAQTTGLRIETISGHNSGIYHNSGNVSTYTYQIAADTVRTVFNGTTGQGDISARLLINEGGSGQVWKLQIKANSNYGTSVSLYIGAALNDMYDGTI